MEADEHVRDLGGVASRAELLALMTEAALRRALAAGTVVRVARGRYATPVTVTGAPRWQEATEQTALRARRAAHEVSGTAVLLSAAASWGWSTKWVPRRPQVAVPRGRKVSREVQQRLEVHWRSLPGGRVDGWRTDRARTAVDCAATLAADEALCVLDSALREGVVSRDELLLTASADAPRLGRRAERLIRLATPDAANPFESVLRYLVSDVEGLSVVPQLRICDDDGFVGTVDLADEQLRIVLEADSYEFHSSPERLQSDCTRYTRLVADDWLVLRFTWDQVMNHQAWVRRVVTQTVAVRLARRAGRAT